ncbi:MAG: GAF domain-containing protein [Reichenbachiella sp.]|uniref:GAF domain-containing protein n=1 Tax=Reichenbachiella sp. TaxID=2184521 RepID=UPI003262E6C7
MAENLFLPETDSRTEKYEALLPQIEALISSESDLMANLANITAALKAGLDFFWVGFYLVKEGELVLGPFQGPIACTRIQKGKGVCGKAWEEKRTVIVEDVDQFPGHIACSSASKSEIVVPALIDGEVKLILDVDSDRLSDFNGEDQKYLESLMKIIESKLSC